MNFIPTHTTPASTMGRHAAITLCAAASSFVFCGGAFAQIDSEEKLSIADKT